jgi:hypothetical protein
MGSRSSGSYRARRLERERERRQRQEGATGSPPPSVGSADPLGDMQAARAVAVPCAWCGVRVTPRARGPIPTWCSATCRHRAWEQARAAASGRSAVEVVERRIEVLVALVPTRRSWPRVLGELTAQLEDGRLYGRDLAPLATAMTTSLAALRRRMSLLPQPNPAHPISQSPVLERLMADAGSRPQDQPRTRGMSRPSGRQARRS